MLRVTNAQIKGRPSRYPNVSKKLVYQLYLLGLTDVEVAAILEVSRETIDEWKNTFPDFSDTIKQAKEIADAQVANALRDRALGSKIPAVKFFQKKNGKIVRVKYTEHYPPSESAGMFWLRNRQKRLFTEKPEDDNGKLPTSVTVQVVTNDETMTKLLKDREERQKKTSDNK